jgi:GT2 family glycosyltransferase
LESSADGEACETLLSVVVPCRGHAQQLQRCLAALCGEARRVPSEVIVVNSGGDPEVAAVAAQFEGVRVAESDIGLHPGAARNLGASEARGVVLAFIDADCVPEPGWLDAAAGGVSSDSARLAGGPVLDARPFRAIAAADNLLQFVDFPEGRPDGPATHLPSSNLAVRREAYWELGGMTPEHPLCEDGLFSTAAASRWPDGLRFVNAMRVRHDGRGTLRSFLEHQRSFGFHRGRIGSRLRRASYQRWGRSRLFAVPIVCVRLAYLFRTTVRWNPRGLLRWPLLLPYLLAGLVVWAGAFRRGCLAAAASDR